ncbi:MAG: ribonuclease R [Alphaproteobacteria bacterium]|nr:ribonuclease R [Alphaproteobacteria bacterium]
MTKAKAPFPGMEEIVAYLNDNPGKVGKRELARAFHIKGDDRVQLKNMLKELKRSGKMEKASGKKLILADGLPETCPCLITGTDSDGELIARPLNWNKQTSCPQILITDPGRLRPAPQEGDMVLLKLTPKGKRFFHGAVLRRLSEQPNRIVGVFDTTSGKGGRILSVDRRLHQNYIVDRAHTGKAKNGDVVIAKVPQNAFDGTEKYAKIIQVIGPADAPHAASLIALHLHAIPVDFTEKALRQAQKTKLPDMKKRTDLRDIPLVTIDGEDARDFDDAVFAEPDEDKKNKDGFHIIAAIADVAYFVRPHSDLDDCARERGNSVYFPDRCIPMLPEKLSADLCSLKPNADRPCLAAHLWINKNGRLIRYKFVRAMMRSAARLNYHEVQNVFDGGLSKMNQELRSHLLNLKKAYEILALARKQRGALELDVIEREIELDDKGQVKSILPRERLDSHKAVEEFMILANVAAAEALEEYDVPAMYRVHEPPSAEKAAALQTFLSTIGIKAGKAGKLNSTDLNKILDKVRNTPRAAMISELILRSQSQARYSPENSGHFGLALEKYVHFTSPIRRYADLLVHRGLISALRLGNDGLIDEDGNLTADLEDLGDHISATERRATAAERDAEERYLSAYLKDRIGEKFSGTINGVNRFGLFVTLDDIGAEGLIPISTLPNDYYIYEEERRRLFGSSTGNTYELGEHIFMTLAEAAPVTGGLLFHILDSGAVKRRSAAQKKKKAPRKTRETDKRKAKRK